MVYELYELQAQLARIPLEDLATLSRGSRWQARVAGSYCLELKRTCKEKQLPSQLTENLLQALIKFCANSLARTRAADALISGSGQRFFKKDFTMEDYVEIKNRRVLKSGGPPRKSSAS
ncbi:hypothetical protein HBI56_122650 [Parastagonospora nodorum]|nr:hypothetical protein HBH56_052030 [Parastagonospora nodorum]QRD02145.1 hypothetical protein JI435_440410 [Parastagonospora nodorum SN15]KAH3935339.1 hypothetical protein HBH54_037820 [Parastagonospora nodorum]KAH3948815.1 hypothetical protein HBH53_101340 [Parastagonospora nodorum]KAH3989113.1 hypothetical protein HBH52_026530 [Parastagonospora nodorum]